jgi:hypothetical protein
MEELYYIRTEGYSGNTLIWWRPNSKGYTADLNKAGKYSKEEAKKICKGSQTELAYNVEKVDLLKKGIMRVVHCDFLRMADADIDYRPKDDLPF